MSEHSLGWETRKEPLTGRQRAELRGYVSPRTAAARAVLFLLAVAIVAGLAWRVQSWFAPRAPWWIVAAGLFAVVLYHRAGRWTGGRELRRWIRRDLEENATLVHRLRVRDAIKVEEAEDEGPTFFLQLEGGEAVALLGQELARVASRGFPRRVVEIRETPHAHRVLGIRGRGERLDPSLVRCPLGRAEAKRLGLGQGPWQRLELDYERIKSEWSALPAPTTGGAG